MPLTKKGNKIMTSMVKEYGVKKGKQVFYASQNKGIITGTHKSKKRKAPKFSGRTPAKGHSSKWF